MRSAMLLTAALALTGCASIVTGTSHTMAVSSEPAGATCKLERSGETIGYVNQTPSTVGFSKSSRPVVVSCDRDNKKMLGTATVEPSLQPWFLGNILLGGIIGIVVDASSGAVSQYPSSTTVVLNPSAQATPAASVQPLPETAGKPVS